MNRNMIGALAAGAAAVLALTACTPAGQNGPPSPAFSTIPSTPLDTAGAEQIMRDFWYAHDRCGNSGNSGLPIDPVQCSRASGMMSTLPNPCISGYPTVPADVEKCAEALRDSGKPAPSAAPATATKPALPPLHDDPTAGLSLADMIHAMSVRGVDLDKLDGKRARGMGELTMRDYIGWNASCKESGSAVNGCGARDVRRSNLPSRCVIEAERQPVAADAPALCGLALLYVQHVGGGGK